MLIENSIKKFKNFNSSKWIDWISNEINGVSNKVNLSLTDLSVEEKLVILYKKLSDFPTSRETLVKASVILLVKFSQTKENPKGIYSLILFIGFSKPEQYAIELEILLKSEKLKTLNYGKLNLQNVLINELIDFINVDSYKEFFFTQIQEDENTICKLIGLKYFIRRQKLGEYFNYLEKLIISEKFNQLEADFISTEIVESLSDLGYYRKQYQEIHLWLESFWEELKEFSNTYYTLISQKLLNWLHDENLLIKTNNEYAIKIRDFVQSSLSTSDGIPNYLNLQESQKYSFDEFEKASDKLPPIKEGIQQFRKYAALKNDTLGFDNYNELQLFVNWYSLSMLRNPERRYEFAKEFAEES